MVTVTHIWRASVGSAFAAPFLPFLVPGGLPSHSDDMEDEPMDLASLLMGDPAETFFVRITGDSCADFGARSGDVLIVDSKAEPVDRDMVVVSIGSAVMVKRLRYGGSGDGAPGAYLESGEGYENVLIGEHDEVIVNGVVTSSVTQFDAQRRLGRRISY